MKGNFCEDTFWALNETWNSHIPLFSSCFEDSVFVFTPCCTLIIILLCHQLHLTKRPSQHGLLLTPLSILKFVLSLTLVGISSLWCILEFCKYFSEEYVPLSQLVASSVRTFLFIIIFCIMLRHQFSGVAVSNVLDFTWLILTFSSIMLHRSVILKYIYFDSPQSQMFFITNMVFHPVIYIQLILTLFPNKRKFQTLNEKAVMDDLPLLYYVTFTWFYRIIYKSRKNLLTIADLSFLSIKITSANVYSTFEQKFKGHLISNVKQSLAWCLLRAFWVYFVLAFTLEFAFLICILLPPLILDRIIDFVHNDYYEWRGYLFVATLFVVDFFGKLTLNNCLYFENTAGIQLKSALLGTLYRKVLTMSTSTRKAFNSGNIMALASVDIKRIEWFTGQCLTIVSAPIRLILIIYIMWQYLGIATLAGVGVMAILVPFNLVIMRSSWKMTDKQMQLKDDRLKYMTEILNGIKILKLYAWELPFASKVSKTRKEELKYVFYGQLYYVVMAFIFFCAPFMVCIATFAVYLMMDERNVLDPTKAFVSITLMDQLRYALFDLPDAIADLVQSNISLGRLRKFFTSENIDPDLIGNKPNIGEVLTIKDASLTWDENSEHVLQDINLNVPKGSLVGIIGPVGSGKSSLLSSVLGEVYKVKGSIDLKGSIAYVPQQAWILNRTLKDNILMVRHFVEEKYNKILDLCCLRPDLEILPAGDQTEIGEKGVNLSGGQKQRVSIARAVYQDKDIYLLDDPLSAVDVHVRKVLFDGVIGKEGLLKRKTRILVTHDVTYLHRMDFIVRMKDGKIAETGTYAELMENKGEFATFVEEHAKISVEDVVENPKNFSRLKSSDSAKSKTLWDDGDSGDYEDKEDIHRLTEDERMEIGGVHYKVYWHYMQHIGLPLFVLSVIGYMAFVGFEASGNVWLSKWSAKGIGTNVTQNSTSTSESLIIYGSLGLAQGLSVVLGIGVLVYGLKKAAQRYHNEMLDSVLKSPMSFFDSTPMGRILNRFSTDMDIVDIQMMYRIDGWLTCVFSALSSFVIIGMNTPIFLATLIPLAVVYYLIQRIHLNCFRQIKRLESTSRSPVFSQILETIQGVSSIGAYKAEKEFIHGFEEKLDRNLVCSYNSNVANRWLNIHLDSLGSIIILITTALAIEYRESLNSAIIGLMIAYALQLTDSLNWFVKMNTELEDKSISVERIDEYCHLKPEAAWNVPEDEYKQQWPMNGTIVFDDYSTRYREGLDLVLKDLNLVVNGREKVGIVGRTGAGKSSITLALFRIVEPESGTILIDNFDICNVGLHALRSKLTIIPQDPVLFTGSLRLNLDPHNEYSDEKIWTSLEQSHLKAFVISLDKGLEHEIEESGANLSAGQRQLVCLARALLKNSRILVLDEATASVDMETDSLIQNTIRTAFADRTVLTIAHRIHTVADYDKIVVLDRGCIVEVGKPSDLLQDSESRFYKMVQETGM